MPSYIWLLNDDLDTASTPAKIRAMQTLGVPYPEGYDAKANADLMKQANEIYADLMKTEEKLLPSDNPPAANREVIAMIAYLQRLGRDIEAGKPAEKK
jgi:cytochrome c oxidase cbb3-type subunit I/II